jgi:uncharacterized membrane protein YsdA (DUF1294 family)/cold shock CspA family protein
MYTENSQNAIFLAYIGIIKGEHVQLKGKITTWNAQKAFGFIAPFAGGSQIFIHIKAFQNRTRVPEINDVVTFFLAKDKDGRACAEKALYAGEKIKKTRKLSRGKLSIALALALLVALNVGSYMGYVPMPLKYAYYGLSIITFIAYAYDKFKAKRNAWRTPESTLHFLALLGGWPGAALAQQVCRHKSSKRGFRVMFWVTVFINLAMLAWLLSPYGKKLLMLIPNSIRFF